jgi:hypothetical protein
MQKTTIHRIRRKRDTMEFDLLCAAMILFVAVPLIGHVAGSNL